MKILSSVQQRLTETAADRPEILDTLEKTIGKKFDGPFSGGTEWDMTLKMPKDPFEAIRSMGILFEKLRSLGLKKDYSSIASMSFVFSVTKGIKVYIDVDKSDSLTVLVEDNTGR